MLAISLVLRCAPPVGGLRRVVNAWNVIRHRSSSADSEAGAARTYFVPVLVTVRQG